MYESALKSYEQVNFFTADPLKLILMCYDRAISSLKQAQESYAVRDYAAKGIALKKVLDILHELNASLDMKKGGEIAGNLRTLYMYMTQALIEADLKKDMKTFDAVIRMLEELEAAWREILHSRSREAAPLMSSLPVPGIAAQQPRVASRAWSA